jgi:putative chitinase
MSDEINQELIEQMRNLADTISASGQSTMVQTEILKKMAQAQGVQVNNIAGLDKQFGSLGGKVSQQSALYQANQQAAEEYGKAMANLSAAAASTATGLKSFGSALLDTEKNFAKYNSALTSVGDAAWQLGKNFGILGASLGGLIKATTFMAEQWTKQADATLKATDDLSKMGAAGSITTDQVLEMGHKAGLTSKNIDVLTKAAGKVGSGFAAMGDTVGDGVIAFGKMTAVTSEQRQAFQRLGVSQEELMDRQADYIKLQELSGKSLSGSVKDQERVKQESLEYAEQLSRLNVLTGKSVAKLQDEQNQVQLEYEEQLAERMTQNKIRKLKEEHRDKEAEDLENQEKKRIDFQKLVTATYGVKKGLEVARVARTGQFDSKTKGLAQLGLTVEDVQQGAKGGEQGAAVFNEKLKKAADTMTDNLGDAILRSANSEQLGTAMGLDKETGQRVGNLAGRDEVKALADATAKTTGTATGSSTAGGAAATDPAQKARNKLTETEIKAQVKVDELVQSTNPLLKGFDAVTTAATGLAIAAGLAATALGVMAGKSAFGGAKNFLGKGKASGIGNAVAGEAGAVEGVAAKELGMLGKMAGVASKATKLLGPIGAIVSAGVAAKEGYDKFQDIDAQQKAGEISKNDATVKKSEAVGSGIGSAAGGAGGAWAGAAAGAAMGSFVPVVGTVVGGLLGAAIGGWLGSKGGEIVGEKVGKVTGDALKSTETPAEKKEIAKKADAVTKSNTTATEKLQITFDKLTRENTDALIDLTQALNDLSNIQTMDKQAGTAEEKNERLNQIFTRLGGTRGGGRLGAAGTAPTGTISGGPANLTSGGAGTTPADIAKSLSAAGISDPTAQANILAQIKGETGDFKAKSENLNYSADTLMKLFPNKVKSRAEAESIAAQGPEAVGNLIYGGRMGNSANEGYAYRGRGLIGLTGKDNYAKFGKLIGMGDALVKNPDLANDPEVAKRILVAYFQEAKKHGTNLNDIKSVGSAVGYATGPQETQKRAGYASQFAAALGTGGAMVASASVPGASQTPNASAVLAKDKMPASTTVASNTASVAQSAQNAMNKSDPVLDSIVALNVAMSTRLDTLINTMSKGNDIQHKIYKVSAA